MEFLLQTSRAASVERVLTDPETDLHTPALCDVEVAAALRRVSFTGALTDERRGQAVADYTDLPLTRHGHLPLLLRILELRQNMSAYDATYVALAEHLGAGLLTADRRLARAVADHTGVKVL